MIRRRTLSWAGSDFPTRVARSRYSRKNLWLPCGDGGPLVLRRRQRERLLRRRNGLLHVVFGVGRAQERRFILRRRQVDAVFEHRSEETSEGLGVGLGCRSPIGDWARCEEPGK